MGTPSVYTSSMDALQMWCDGEREFLGRLNFNFQEPRVASGYRFGRRGAGPAPSQALRREPGWGRGTHAPISLSCPAPAPLRTHQRPRFPDVKSLSFLTPPTPALPLPRIPLPGASLGRSSLSPPQLECHPLTEASPDLALPSLFHTRCKQPPPHPVFCPPPPPPSPLCPPPWLRVRPLSAPLIVSPVRSGAKHSAWHSRCSKHA